MALSKRIAWGILAAVLAGITYSFGHVLFDAPMPGGGAVLSFSSLLKQGGLPALWLAFLSALAGVAGAVIAETRRIRVQSAGYK